MFTLLSAANIDKFASEVGYQRDYDSALKLAKEQKKMLMLLVVGDYCPWCKKFERKTLKSPPVAAKVKEDFVAVVIDKYKDKGNYPKKFFSPLIPAVFFIDPASGEPLSDTVGYMKKKEFMDNIDEALAVFKKEA